MSAAQDKPRDLWITMARITQALDSSPVDFRDGCVALAAVLCGAFHDCGESRESLQQLIEIAWRESGNIAPEERVHLMASALQTS